MYFTLVETSFGHIGIVHRDIVSSGVVRVLLPRPKKEILHSIRIQYPDAQLSSSDSLGSLQCMFIGYFDGNNVKFPLDVIDSSLCYPFQIEVLEAEWLIPYGKTASFQDFNY